MWRRYWRRITSFMVNGTDNWKFGKCITQIWHRCIHNETIFFRFNSLKIKITWLRIFQTLMKFWSLHVLKNFFYDARNTRVVSNQLTVVRMIFSKCLSSNCNPSSVAKSAKSSRNGQYSFHDTWYLLASDLKSCHGCQTIPYFYLLLEWKGQRLPSNFLEAFVAT